MARNDSCLQCPALSQCELALPAEAADVKSEASSKTLSAPSVAPSEATSHTLSAPLNSLFAPTTTLDCDVFAETCTLAAPVMTDSGALSHTLSAPTACVQANVADMSDSTSVTIGFEWSPARYDEQKSKQEATLRQTDISAWVQEQVSLKELKEADELLDQVIAHATEVFRQEGIEPSM